MAVVQPGVASKGPELGWAMANTLAFSRQRIKLRTEATAVPALCEYELLSSTGSNPSE